MHSDIQAFNNSHSPNDKAICDVLYHEISKRLPEGDTESGTVLAKIWHGHPVWFLDDNPITGYSKQKPGIRLMFWSGADFDEEGLNVKGAKFKDASVFYNSVEEINTDDLQRWLEKTKHIQWDYKNLIKRKGKLERLK